ncbi:hypothetical protein TNCT_630541 [Trichonephila clavata]|uniref:Uncharacterized protein n=1 Tax=Trichonephila clavata TaxID=2740835 RepID=A0A8X6M1J7_TRICU|nr:hypothetical protein TNCT_630541 [Trichonephila clavata]
MEKSFPDKIGGGEALLCIGMGSVRGGGIDRQPILSLDCFDIERRCDIRKRYPGYKSLPARFLGDCVLFSNGFDCGRKCRLTLMCKQVAVPSSKKSCLLD